MRIAPGISAVGRALPPHYVDQETLLSALRQAFAAQHFNPNRIDDLHRAVKVGGRHLALPMEAYAEHDTFQKCNTAWQAIALDLAEEATLKALAQANLPAETIDHIFFTTVTGLAVPSIDARLINRIGLRSDVKRTPIFGLGCVGGAAGIARAADYLRAFPKQTALLISVELCSLTLQKQDLSVPNLIASGLFGDGAAAVLLRGAEADSRPRPAVCATRSVFYRDTERVMGWDFVDSGFKIVLSAAVPDMVTRHIAHDVDSFLSSEGLSRRDIQHYVVHTGGPKVLQAFSSALELPADALQLSWKSLEQVGNLSSASVLFVLADTLAEGRAQPGDLGLLIAMGPGFCSELVLLKW